MITFQKIRWKNFLSTGDQFSEIDFQKNATNLIVGTNGTGKSTVLDALTFSLFNKPFRKINKSQLVNATNEKDTQVEVEFDIVYSGHFHTRSTNGKISYLGNPYEMFWNDVNDPRGFNIFDTETLKHTPINNPYRLFYNIYYEDTNYKLFDTREFKDKIVKVVVKKKTDQKQFEKFIDKLYNSGIQDLKIIENFVLTESADFEVEETENTIGILNRYIDESEFEGDKTLIKGILQQIYTEACEVD